MFIFKAIRISLKKLITFIILSFFIWLLLYFLSSLSKEYINKINLPLLGINILIISIIIPIITYNEKSFYKTVESIKEKKYISNVINYFKPTIVLIFCSLIFITISTIFQLVYLITLKTNIFKISLATFITGIIGIIYSVFLIVIRIICEYKHIEFATKEQNDKNRNEENIQ